jgi:hypothetical protein
VHALGRILRVEVEQTPELVVARHAALAHAQNVDRREIDEQLAEKRIAGAGPELTPAERARLLRG